MLKRNFWTFFFSFWTLGAGFPSAPGGDSLSSDLIQLSDSIENFRVATRDLFKDSALYLTGGSARSILVHLMSGEPLRMKDIDIAVVTPEVNDSFMARVSSTLEQKGISRLVKFVPKPWANGLGLFHTLIDDSGIIDLAVFPNRSEFLHRNGILNIERIKIVLPPNQTLSSIALEARRKFQAEGTVESLSSMEHVLDRDSGLKAWVDRNPKIVLEDEVHTNPIVTGMRFIRMMRRYGISVPDEILTQLKSATAVHTGVSNLERTLRHFSYFFDDSYLGEELKIAQEVGTLAMIDTNIHRFIEGLSPQQIDSLFPIVDQTPLSPVTQRSLRLKSFLERLPPETSKNFAQNLGEFYPELRSFLKEIDSGCEMSLENREI